MMWIIVFAITMVITQVLAGICMMCVFMSDWFIKMITKRSFKLMKTIERDINDWMSEEEEA